MGIKINDITFVDMIGQGKEKGQVARLFFETLKIKGFFNKNFKNEEDMLNELSAILSSNEYIKEKLASINAGSLRIKRVDNYINSVKEMIKCTLGKSYDANAVYVTPIKDLRMVVNYTRMKEPEIRKEQKISKNTQTMPAF